MSERVVDDAAGDDARGGAHEGARDYVRDHVRAGAHDDAGVTASAEDAEFAVLAEKITRETSFRCASYKDKCLRRRIAVRMRACGVSSFAEYAALLDVKTDEYARLLDALTINVTKFFRNWSAFEAIRREVIPVLWNTPGLIRVWSAGCASGEEPYSLAAMFYGYAADQGTPDEATMRVRIVGTDIDRASLDAARVGSYADTAFVDTPDEVADRYFPRLGDRRSVGSALRSMVYFERRDLLHEPPPSGVFDLITCRNVAIYFGREAQETLFSSFHRVLAPGGFLVLGRVETLLGRPRSLFTPVDLRERVFRRNA